MFAVRQALHQTWGKQPLTQGAHTGDEEAWVDGKEATIKSVL